MERRKKSGGKEVGEVNMNSSWSGLWMKPFQKLLEYPLAPANLSVFSTYRGVFLWLLIKIQ